MFNQYLKILPCKIGKGTFTTIDIPANVAVMEITGPLVDRKALPADYSMYLQIGTNTFLGPSGSADDYINHSCNPNCRMHIIGNRAILYSMYIIKADSELTFDYSTTSTDTPGTWKMTCTCGAFNCRKTISGISTVDEKTQTEYQKKNMLPLYITNPMFKQL